MSFDPLTEQTNASPTAPLLEPTFLERHGISPILFAFISLLIIFFLYQIIGSVAAYLIAGGRPTAGNVTEFRLTTLFGQLLLLLLPALFLTRLISHHPPSFLRLRRPTAGEVLIPFVGIFSLQQMFQVYMVVQEKIPLPEAVRSPAEQLKQIIEEAYRVLVSSHSIPELMFVVLVVGVIPAFSEEVLFRGLVQRSFERGLGTKRGLLLTAIIFAMYHLNPFTFIPLLGLGLYLGFLTLRSNSLWTAVAAHFYNNLFACVAVFIQKDDAYLVTGKPDQLSAGMLAFTFLSFSLVFLLSTYYFVRVSQPSSPSSEG